MRKCERCPNEIERGKYCPNCKIIVRRESLRRASRKFYAKYYKSKEENING